MKKFKKIPKKYVFEQNYSNMVMEEFENFSMDFLNENQETYLNENSLGQKIVPDDDPIKLQNFWKWFGNSKCVDEKGRPLVVYHGTQSKFNSFRYGKRGIYFASLKRRGKVAGYYAKDTGYILACYLKMENPFVGNPSEVWELKEKYEKNKNINYDGLISICNIAMDDLFYNYETCEMEESKLNIGDIVEFVVFNPNQIKSINNKGMFSSSSDNIFESENQAISTLPNENSLGEKIVPDDDPIKLQNFWKWFGNSKCVDEKGRPFVVYHMSRNKFDKFDIDKSNGGSWGDGFYFSSDKLGEWMYGETEYSCYLKLDNPCIINFPKTYGDYVKLCNDILDYHDKDSMENNYDYFLGYPKTQTAVYAFAKIYRELYGDNRPNKIYKDKGFDSVVIKDSIIGSQGDVKIKNEVLVFDPNQIKSINNKGTFSSSSDNIFEALNLEEFPNRQKVTVYHGSSNKNLKIKDDSLIYFTTNKEDAIRWADRFILGGKKNKKSYVYTAEITFDKPYVIGDKSVNSEYKKYEDQPEKEKKEIFSEIFYDDLNENRSELISKGYDCFIDNQISDNITYYIIPSQFMDNIKWLKIEDKESL